MPRPAAVESVDIPDNKASPDPIQATLAPKQKTIDMGPLTRKRFDETLKWLEATEDSRWFIQLLSTDPGSAAHLENFLGTAARLVAPAELRVYSVEFGGTRRMGVIYGDYPSREAAMNAMGSLPQALKLYGPYPRQVRRLRS